MLPARVLIVIVNYRTPALALGVLDSLEAEVTARGDTHVALVDNGSGDGSAGTIAAGIADRGFGGWCTPVALADNRGFSAGNNAGLDWYRQTTGDWPDYVWLLNPDTRALPEAIGPLVRFLEAHPTIGIAGGRCLWEDGRVWPSAFGFPSPCSEFVGALDFGPLTRFAKKCGIVVPVADEPVRADWVSGASMMIARRVIAAIGPMDEGYFLYFEETDYCARAAAAGFACWIVPASRVTHLGGQATGVTGDKYHDRPRPHYWFASRARYFRYRYGAARTHFANLLWLAGAPIGFVITAIRGKRSHYPRRFWRDFLLFNYGPGGIMYRPATAAARPEGG